MNTHTDLIFLGGVVTTWLPERFGLGVSAARRASAQQTGGALVLLVALLITNVRRVDGQRR